jgi:hypothetical protein
MTLHRAVSDRHRHQTHLRHNYAATGRPGRPTPGIGAARVCTQVTAIAHLRGRGCLGDRSEVVALKVGGSSPLGHPRSPQASRALLPRQSPQRVPHPPIPTSMLIVASTRPRTAGPTSVRDPHEQAGRCSHLPNPLWVKGAVSTVWSGAWKQTWRRGAYGCWRVREWLGPKSRRSGCEPVTLDDRDVPGCPPGPVYLSERSASLRSWRYTALLM